MRTIKSYGALTIHVANSQTKGIGQYGREWISQPGKGIYLSLRNTLTIKNEKNILSIAQLGAITMAHVLNELNMKVQLKWPNDLYFNDKKLGGIIVEVVESKNHVCEYILGLGVNLSAPNVLDHAIGINDINNIEKDSKHLIQAFVNQWDDFVHIFSSSGLSSFQALWQKYDYLSSKVVTIKLHDKETIGQSDGINEFGEFKLVTLKGRSLLFDHQASIINIT